MKPLFTGVLLAMATLPAFADEQMLSLIQRCAPNVSWSTMSAIVKVESGGNMFALADAGPRNLPWSIRKNMVRSFYLSTKEEAARLAHSLIAQGHTVSLGLGQVNDRNLPRLGLSIEDVLDPCTNLASSGKILTEFYNKAVKQYGPGEKALHAAISGYNSGSFIRGVENGYVGLVIAAAGTGVVPALKSGPRSRRSHTSPANAAPIVAVWTTSSQKIPRKLSRQGMLKVARESPLAEIKISFEEPTGDKNL